MPQQHRSSRSSRILVTRSTNRQRGNSYARRAVATTDTTRIVLATQSGTHMSQMVILHQVSMLYASSTHKAKETCVLRDCSKEAYK
jgi:hypothetical protein